MGPVMEALVLEAGAWVWAVSRSVQQCLGAPGCGRLGWLWGRGVPRNLWLGSRVDRGPSAL